MKKKTRTLNCRIDEELYQRLQKIKFNVGDNAVSLSTVVQTALYEYVKIREGEKSLELINTHILEAINSSISLNTRQLKKDMTTMNRSVELILLVLKENLEIDSESLSSLEEILNKNSRANI